MTTLRMLLVDDTPDELEAMLNTLRRRFAEREIRVEIDIILSRVEAVTRIKEGNPYDLVLLDIVGVEYEEFLREIRALYPYLPIVMFSRQAIPEEMTKCIDLGAQNFIFKLDLRIGLRRLSPLDEWEDEDKWNRVIDRIQKLVEGYRPIKRIIESSSEIGWIRKTGGKDSVIADQIAFLEYVKNIPALAPLFPRMTKTPWTEGEHTFYEMPFYRMKSLRKLIFGEDDQERCTEIAKRVLADVLDLCFKHLYTHNVRKDVYAEFVQTMYFEKYRARLQEVTTRVTELIRTRGSSSIIEGYQRLLSADTIRIEHKTLRNPMEILDELQKDLEFIGRLNPPFLCTIHGDLHFDNILVDDRLPERVRIKLIDPRGFYRDGYSRGVGDIAYDIGKLLHSADGYYDFIHTRYLTVDPLFNYPDPSVVEVPALRRQEWATEPIEGGGSGDIITSHKGMVQPWAWDTFDTLAEFIAIWIEQSEYARTDPDCRLRAEFNEAMHFCTMGRFHIQNDVARTIAIHIRGIELMNEFLKQYNSGKFDS